MSKDFDVTECTSTSTGVLYLVRERIGKCIDGEVWGKVNCSVNPDDVNTCCSVKVVVEVSEKACCVPETSGDDTFENSCVVG